MRTTPTGRCRALALMVLAAAPAIAAAQVTDFNTWTQVQDPPNVNFIGSVGSAAQVTLQATAGPVPNAVDIGYQSVSGATVATSAQGFYFDPAASFTIAVDYAFSSTNASGNLGLGFGIGEDINGTDSAGVAVAIVNGVGAGVLAASRVNDVSSTPLLSLGAPLTGSMIVGYDATTGNVTVGVAAATGVNTPTTSTTLSGIQNQWDDEPLLASFFLRSEGWTSGQATAVFSNFRVAAGSATAIPEPTAAAALAAAAPLLLRRRREHILP